MKSVHFVDQQWSDIDKPLKKTLRESFPYISPGRRQKMTYKNPKCFHRKQIGWQVSVFCNKSVMYFSNIKITPRVRRMKKPPKFRRLQSPRSTWSWQWPPGGNFRNFGRSCVWTQVKGKLIHQQKTNSHPMRQINKRRLPTPKNESTWRTGGRRPLLEESLT